MFVRRLRLASQFASSDLFPGHSWRSGTLAQLAFRATNSRRGRYFGLKSSSRLSVALPPLSLVHPAFPLHLGLGRVRGGTRRAKGTWGGGEARAQHMHRRLGHNRARITPGSGHTRLEVTPGLRSLLRPHILALHNTAKPFSSTRSARAKAPSRGKHDTTPGL